MSKAKLFTPLRVGALELPNRIVIAPMCQYSAVDGCMTDWHLMHLGHLALSGAALLTIEATAVVPEGRITYADVGLWSDATEAAMGRVLESVRRWSDMPIAVQLAHAGRKASHEIPWKGGRQITPDEPNGWLTEAPSSSAFLETDVPPAALDRAGLARVRDAFAQSARRAARLGLNAVQLHGAHGYLLHEFLSPLSNLRTDEYGGSLENRMRFPLEVFDAVRAAFPAERHDARVGDGLGGRRMGRRADGGLRARARGARLQRRARVEWRADGFTGDPVGAELSGSAGTRGEGGDVAPRGGRRVDHRVRAGGGDPWHGGRGPYRSRARDAVRSALAVACGGRTGRAGAGAAAVLAQPAARVQGPVRRLSLRRTLTTGVV
jgi:hypothetical protein